MIYNLYNALKGQISPLEGVAGVEWFKAQYEGTAGIDGHVYIEVMPLEIATGSKSARQATVEVRLHVLTADTSAATSGDTPATPPADRPLELNDALAQRVADAVEGLRLPFGEGETRPFELSAWSFQHKFAGWLVTQVELKAKAV